MIVQSEQLPPILVDLKMLKFRNNIRFMVVLLPLLFQAFISLSIILQCSSTSTVQKELISHSGKQNIETDHLAALKDDSYYDHVVGGGAFKFSKRFKRRLKSSELPEFSAPIGNVTAVLGRDVRLICTVENLGQYQVAWLKEESKTILSIDTNIIITNYRIFLIPDEEERKWVLHIKDVQESDRGFYQCQVNTSPMRSTSGYLEVVVPPTIIESQSTRVSEVVEHSDIGLQCKANGHPRPTITWRRDDGSPIRLNGRLGFSSSHYDEPANQTSSLASLLATGHRINSSSLIQLPSAIQQTTTTAGAGALSQLTDVKSDKLSLKSVDRSMAGIYVCTASNGIPSQVSKRIPLYVKFAPKTSVSNKYISVSLGDELEIDCIIEAFPKANSYWSKKSLSSSSMQQDLDRGQWGDAVRWMQLSSANRATLHRPKQILHPDLEASGESANSEAEAATTSLASPIDLKVIKHSSASIDDQSGQNLPQNNQQSPSNSDTMSGGKDLISSFGGNFRWPPTTGPPGLEQVNSSSTSPSKAYVTVRQAPLNTFTYKLRLTIARMQPDDYGEYTCVSSNSMGNSESKVMVTKADKIRETTADRQAGSSDYRSIGEDDYERDGAADQARPSSSSANNHNQQSSIRRGSSSHNGNRVVYDGNYLQAIKTRQSNLLGPNRLQQQNLRLRQFSDRSSASPTYCRLRDSVHIYVIISLTVASIWSILANRPSVY